MKGENIVVIGECFHLVNSFICSEGKHQNFPCPYQGDFKKCPNCIVTTQSMVDQMDKHGFVSMCQNHSVEVSND